MIAPDDMRDAFAWTSPAEARAIKRAVADRMLHAEWVRENRRKRSSSIVSWLVSAALVSIFFVLAIILGA